MSDRKSHRELLESLIRISRKLRTVFNARVTAHGLTYARARTLLRLAERPLLNQKQLACELDLEQPTLARLLDRMEELDLIHRRDVPGDRRAKQIALTEYGHAQAELVARIGQEIRDEMFAHISAADIKATIAVLAMVEEGASLMVENRGAGEPV